jgi:hypothetical protein
VGHGITFENASVLELDLIETFGIGPIIQLSDLMNERLRILQMAEDVFKKPIIILLFHDIRRNTPKLHELVVKVYNASPAIDDKYSVRSGFQRGPLQGK